MKLELRTINKEIAQVLLENNINNRKANKDHINALAIHMKEGNWKSSGDPIRISKTGRLLDGQHRLMAIVKSDTSNEFVVISELEDEVFDVIDTGKNRNAADMLKISNISNGNTIAGIIKLVIAYEKELSLLGAASTHQKQFNAPFKVLERYNTDPLHWQETHRNASRYYEKSKLLYPSEYGLLYHIFSKIKRSDAEEFLEKLSAGIDLKENDPILLLRNRLIEYKSNKFRVSFKLKLGLIFIAWNHYRKGNELKMLRFNVNSELVKPI